MNSYLYDDIEIEETPEFQLYQTELNFWLSMIRFRS